MRRRYTRNRSLVANSLACMLMMVASASFAQVYPNKPIRLIVPWPPTGTVDILGRTLAQKLSENMGQSVLVDNRGGANGMIGSEAAAKSPPDGYTLVIDNITGHAINATLQAKMPFDSMRDFAHVSLLAWVPDGVVSSAHLAGELFKIMAGIDMLHIPYKGGQPAITALLRSETEKWAKVVKVSGARAE